MGRKNDTNAWGTEQKVFGAIGKSNWITVAELFSRDSIRVSERKRWRDQTRNETIFVQSRPILFHLKRNLDKEVYPFDVWLANERLKFGGDLRWDRELGNQIRLVHPWFTRTTRMEFSSRQFYNMNSSTCCLLKFVHRQTATFLSPG